MSLLDFLTTTEVYTAFFGHSIHLVLITTFIGGKISDFCEAIQAKVAAEKPELNDNLIKIFG